MEDNTSIIISVTKILDVFENFKNLWSLGSADPLDIKHTSKIESSLKLDLLFPNGLNYKYSQQDRFNIGTKENQTIRVLGAPISKNEILDNQRNFSIQLE